MNKAKDSTITAVLDSCVLYPAHLRDLFMHLALKKVFRPRWSDEIHNEWISAVLRTRPDLTESQLLRTRSLMNSNVIGCLIKKYEHHIPNIILPDPKDRHVLAVAIEADADIIVTFNLKDFPKTELNKFNISPSHPDVFLEKLLTKKTSLFLEAITQQISTLKKPPLTKDNFLNLLIKNKLDKTAKKLKKIDW